MDLLQLQNELHAAQPVGDDGELSDGTCPFCEALADNRELLRSRLLQADYFVAALRPTDELSQLHVIKVQTLLGQALALLDRLVGQ